MLLPGSRAPAALGAPPSADAQSLCSEESEASALHFAGVLFGFVFAIGMESSNSAGAGLVPC